MSNKTVIIKIENNKIFFNPSASVNIENTNIPYKYLKFRTNREIFWEVEIINNDDENKTLHLLVKDYNCKDTKRFEGQVVDISLKQIIFEKFDWAKLEPLLIWYIENRLKENAYNFREIELSNNNHFSKPAASVSQPFSPNPQTTSNFLPKTTTKEFWINFDDAKFEAGYISFTKKIEGIDEPQIIKIINEHILPEFENIKSWFARKLKTKRFKVLANISFGDNIEIEASSVHIDQITPELIDSIRYARIDKLTKEVKNDNLDKSVFGADEMFALLNGENVEGNIFKQTEEDILIYFIEKKNVRNKKQLAFLADKKQSTNFKLRYTLPPFFGFLFFVEGSIKNHFVWEMLNSNATYIWSIGKDQINAQLDQVDKIINSIRSKGRTNYKRDYKNQSDIGNYSFNIIRHDDITTQETEGYLKWENKVDKILN